MGHCGGTVDWASFLEGDAETHNVVAWRQEFQPALPGYWENPEWGKNTDFWSWSLVMDGCCVFDPWRGFTDQSRVSEQILQRKMTAWFHGWEGWSEVIYGSKRWFFIIFGDIVIIKNILTYYQKFRKKIRKAQRKILKFEGKELLARNDSYQYL